MTDKYEVLHEELRQLAKAFREHEHACVKNREGMVTQMTRMESDIVYLRRQADENKAGITALNVKFNRVLYSVIALIAIVGGDEAISLIKLVT